MSKRTYSTVSLAKLKGHEDATRQCQESESTDTPSGGWDSWLIDGIGCDATWALFGEESESAKDEWTETMKAKLAAYHEGAMEACAEIDNDSTISGGPHVEGIERGQVEFTGLISLGDQIQSIECGWQGRVTGFEKYHGDDCTYLVCHHVSGGKIEEDDKRWFDPRDVRLLRKAPMTFEEFQKTTLGQRVIAEGYDTCEIEDTLSGLCPGTGTFACNENGIVTVAHVIRAAIVERVLRTVTRERAAEIVVECLKRATIGPWSDQLRKVMTGDEIAQVTEHWKSMSGSSSFSDAILDMRNVNPAPDKARRRLSGM